MRAALGIDAAWTLTQPSGAALATKLSSGWRVIAAASSYQRFHALADPRLLSEPRPSGSLPDAPKLFASASVLCDAPVDLVAIDMPLAHTPIVRRRVSDRAVSKAYGGRKCGTHTPNALRPGPLSDQLRQSFERAGYPLLTNMMAPVGLIEVILIQRWLNSPAPPSGCPTKHRRSGVIGQPPPRPSVAVCCIDK